MNIYLRIYSTIYDTFPLTLLPPIHKTETHKKYYFIKLVSSIVWGPLCISL